MRGVRFTILLSLSLLSLQSCGGKPQPPSDDARGTPPEEPLHEGEQRAPEGPPTFSLRRVELSKFDPSFRFSAEILSGWEVEFVPEITAINVYNPAEEAQTVRERSQIFLRQFEADRCLTLSTVKATRGQPFEALRALRPDGSHRACETLVCSQT